MMRLMPSHFPNDPEGWIGNQSGHTLVGFLCAVKLSFIGYIFFGELPFRWMLWVTIAIGYLAFELYTQGWRWLDTIEDWTFVCVYGAGTTLYSTAELDPGSSVVFVDIFSLLPFLIVCELHCLAGFGARVLWD